jgi:hypothetical protein
MMTNHPKISGRKSGNCLLQPSHCEKLACVVLASITTTTTSNSTFSPGRMKLRLYSGVMCVERMMGDRPKSIDAKYLTFQQDSELVCHFE